jgi:hypothetical protein
MKITATVSFTKAPSPLCSAGVLAGVPNDRSSSLGWLAGCRAGVLACTSLAPLHFCSRWPPHNEELKAES